jgi:hypothetical protein
MKHILLLAMILALVFGSSGASTKPRAVNDSGVSANAVEVEGVTIESQRLARLKPGYTFRRESRSSVSVLKTIREASFQTGTLTCTRADKRACTVDLGGDTAKCSSGCYFVGVRGGVKAQ